MVFNSPVVVGVANLSANACQYVACNPERLPGDQVLYLVFCVPFQQIRRFALYLWSVFCFPLPPHHGRDYHYYNPPPSRYYANSSSSSSSSSLSTSSSGSDLQALHPHLH
ncbi:unnamed protein product [Coffea canephora]|uniref:Uncharacterized protein n=1 Tax=Coffea canephora TaxID=49390 RepID=A0A068V0K8_COFCA|nr:unnamed protein product [Coffea canephora]